MSLSPGSCRFCTSIAGDGLDNGDKDPSETTILSCPAGRMSKEKMLLAEHPLARIAADTPDID